MHNIAILVSGSGTNCENIIRYFAKNDNVNIALVISNKSDAPALERAKRLGRGDSRSHKTLISTMSKRCSVCSTLSISTSSFWQAFCSFCPIFLFVDTIIA